MLKCMLSDRLAAVGMQSILHLVISCVGEISIANLQACNRNSPNKQPPAPFRRDLAIFLKKAIHSEKCYVEGNKILFFILIYKKNWTNQTLLTGT